MLFSLLTHSQWRQCLKTRPSFKTTMVPLVSTMLLEMVTFKYCNFWLKHAKCVQMFEVTWAQHRVMMQRYWASCLHSFGCSKTQSAQLTTKTTKVPLFFMLLHGKSNLNLFSLFDMFKPYPKREPEIFILI